MILWKPIASVGQESFACMKTKGFDIESTHLRHDDRLEKMFAIVSMAAAAALAASKNDNKIQTGKRKNPTRKNHGYAARSVFLRGLNLLLLSLFAPPKLRFKSTRRGVGQYGLCQIK